MKAQKQLLLILLLFALDVATPVVPTPAGLEWDDGKEAFHRRRIELAHPSAATQPTATQKAVR
jgi:hypothetical protein